MKSPECGSKLFGDFFIRDFQDVRQYHKYGIILFYRFRIHEGFIGELKRRENFPTYNFGQV